MRQDIELLRILCTFSIIWYHSDVIGHEVSYAGLIVFLILSMYLAGKSNSLASVLIVHRAERFLVPWAVWFVVYGTKNALFGKSIFPQEHGLVLGVLSGPSLHLWYMPFVFICLVLLDIIKKHVNKLLIAITCGVLSAFVLLATPLWRPESIRLGYPIAQYVHALAGILVGIFFSRFDEIQKKSRQFILLLVIAGALTAIPHEGVGIPYLIGISASFILASRVFEKIPIRDLSPISKLTLGIYLAHVLVMTAIKNYFSLPKIFLPIATFFISATIVLFIRRYFPKLARFCT